MPSPLRPDKRRLPLHVHISVMFTLLLLFTGVVLGIFNYRQTTEIILSSSEKLFERIDQDVRRDLQTTYQPIRRLLSLLAESVAIQGTDLAHRLPLLKPFSQSLRDNTELASLYVGYADGDFFMVRPLRSDALKKTCRHLMPPPFRSGASIVTASPGKPAHNPCSMTRR